MILNIDSKQFEHFENYNIVLMWNSLASTFRFSALKNDFPLPYSYSTCEIISDSGEVLITGEIVADSYSISAKPSSVSVSGYSFPGVLEDCNIPVDLYPLQTDNLSLREIAERIFDKFGLSYVADSIILEDLNKKYKKSTASPSPSIKARLTELCQQRNIILSHNEKGEVLFTRTNINELIPVKDFIDYGLLGVSLETNGQAMHSSITVMRQASDDNPDAGENTIDNPYVEKYRPKTVLLTSGTLFDVKEAAKSALATELGTMKFVINTTEFVKPGNLITLLSEELNIRQQTELFVEKTEIIGTLQGESYILSCVLPNVYDTDMPITNIFSK